jgi:hypothetical protein
MSVINNKYAINNLEGGGKMKRLAALAIFVLVSFAFLTAGTAFAFDSGSTGALGAFNPTTSTTVQLPPDGILNYTTVNIPSGVTVTFTKNAGNTPVYILATGDVTVTGAISVDGTSGNVIAPGKGGTGGFDGGLGGYVGSCGGTGLGFGGGKQANKVSSALNYGAGGGGGGFGTTGNAGNAYQPSYSTGGGGGSSYGNTNLLPMIGGSGGGGGCADTSYIGGSGGGGGGAIVIATSGTINVTGSITANGGNGSNNGYNYSTAGGGGGGSGGGIRLMANIISGNGTVTANGGSGGSAYAYGYSYGGAGGAGRIRLEANTLSRAANTTPTYTFGGSPLAVFPPIIPTLKITKVAGIDVPASPTGAYSSPDVTLPSTATSPVEVVVEAANIPVGTTVTITAVPELGSSSTATAMLSGTPASSTGTAQVSISGKSANILMATATFTFQTASNQTPFYADGEKVVKMRVASVLGGKSSITYITESGKEVQADI